MEQQTDHLETIRQLMPYGEAFCFVDQFVELDASKVVGTYRFREDEWFYPAHFPDRPMTPGVILTECMAQIGLVGLGMYLNNLHHTPRPLKFAFTSSAVEFVTPVLPGEIVTVIGEKVYYRLKKLKCTVSMTNARGERVCYGTLSGMIVHAQENGKT
ncbi:MAG: FabA/FabZ family ACP-dehydratase [Bacteroidota bacterium]